MTLILERLKAGEGDDRGWDGWMASPTQWTWVWVSSRSWWWTGRPGALPSMGLRRVTHNRVTELNGKNKLKTLRSYLMRRGVCGTGACTQRASIPPLEVDQERNRRLRCLPHCKQRARSQRKAAQDCGDAKTIRKVPRHPEKRRTRRCLNSSTSTRLVLWGQKPLAFLLRDLFIPDFVCLGKRRMTEKIT